MILKQKNFRIHVATYSLILVVGVGLGVLWPVFQKAGKIVLVYAQESVFCGSLFVCEDKNLMEQMGYYLEPQLVREIQNNSLDQEDFLSKLRIVMIQKIVQGGYTGFIEVPFDDSNGTLLTSSSGTQYYLTREITGKDIVDLSLSGFEFGKSIRLGAFVSFTGLQNSSGVYLFKTQKDLEYLGYEIISHRVRNNFSDPAYRKFNIKTAFDKIGHVRILNPGDEFSYLDTVDSSETSTGKKIYKFGHALIGDDIKIVYAGGICGGSTAIYQGILTNSGLKIDEGRNHTKWFNGLYIATINGEKIKIPGIDSTVYNDLIDLKIKNVASYPMILVINFDLDKSGIEEIFSLGKSSEKGSFRFIESYTNEFHQRCYIREINGARKISCYNKIL